MSSRPRRSPEAHRARYENYLASPAWEAKKQEFADSGRSLDCAKCGQPHEHMHHQTYMRLTKEQLGDLVPLCASCHLGVHALQKELETSILSATRKYLGWTVEEQREYMGRKPMKSRKRKKRRKPKAS